MTATRRCSSSARWHGWRPPLRARGRARGGGGGPRGAGGPPPLPPAAPRGRRVADPEWRRYTGRFRSGWRDIQVLLMDDGLLIIDPTLPDPMLAPTRLVFASEPTFRAEDTGG